MPAAEPLLSPAPVAEDVDALGKRTLRKASWRLIPLLGLGYGIAYMDRINISFAALQMNRDLHFSATVYGFGAGLFFLSYAACEVPSNLLLCRFGARRWLARIMLTWGILAMAMMFVRTPLEFYSLRFLLGMAEAGFFPGVIFYLSEWFPARVRARVISRFYIAYPLSSAFMGAVAGPLLHLQGKLGLAGWQWLFLLEGLPSALFSVVLWRLLTDQPKDATWLSPRGARLARARDGQRTGRWRARGENRERAARSAGVADWRDLSLHADHRVCVSTLCASNLAAGNRAGSDRDRLAGVRRRPAGSRSHAGQRGPLRQIGRTEMACSRAVFDHDDSVCSQRIAAHAMGGSRRADRGLCVQRGVADAPANAAVYVLKGRPMAAGIAAMNTVGMIGGFIGPWAMGLVKDHTGEYRMGLVALAVPSLVGAGLVLAFRAGARARAPMEIIG